MNKKNLFLIISVVIVVSVVLVGATIYLGFLRLPQEKVALGVRITDDKFKIIKRIPEGTQSGFVEKSKVVQVPVDRIDIVFNHDIDETTLTKNSFYALWGINDRIPGTIKYEKSTKTASLIFNQGFAKGVGQGEFRITIVVEGIKNVKGKELERLLYSVDIVGDETVAGESY